MCNAGTDPRDPFAVLTAAIEGFVHGPAREMTQAQLADHLIAFRHAIDLLELGFATDAAVFASTDEYEVQGSVSPVDWIRHHCHMSSIAAGRAVTSGEQSGRLVGSVGALHAGEIGFGHFTLLASVARALSAKGVIPAVDGATGTRPIPVTRRT
jgi:hypothetical protein